MNVLSRFVAPQDPCGLSTGTDRPRFTRSRRVSDLRTAFKSGTFDDAELAIEQIRSGRSSNPINGVALGEVTACLGAARFRAYLSPTGHLIVPAVLGAHDLESRLTALLAVIGEGAP